MDGSTLMPCSEVAIRMGESEHGDVEAAPAAAEGVAGRGRRRWLVLAGVAVSLLVVGFALFRPDKLVTDNKVDEQLDSEVAAVVDASSSTTAAAPASTVPGAPSTTEQVRELARGEFVGQAGHRVQGEAVVVDRPEGRLLVLPDLDSENGPDLRLYLSPTSEGSVEGGTYLAPLQGNQGTQTYELPPGLDLGAQPNVVIWCDRFSVPFGTAPLTL